VQVFARLGPLADLAAASHFDVSPSAAALSALSTLSEAALYLSGLDLAPAPLSGSWSPSV